VKPACQERLNAAAVSNRGIGVRANVDVACSRRRVYSSYARTRSDS
jgi:hypothetical protein